MDPNIMKLLKEDDDETMHSGADVDAFTAELNRDIEGGASSRQEPSNSNSALSQGICQNTSQFLPHWYTSTHDGIANLKSRKNLVAVWENVKHSAELELQRHGSDPQNRKEDDNSSHECNPLQSNPSVVASSQLQDEQNTSALPHPVSGQPSGEQPINPKVLDHEARLDKELQMDKLQNISPHQSMAMGSNDQQPLSIDFNDQQILPAARGNQQTSTGVSSDQVMPPLNQHAEMSTMISTSAQSTSKYQGHISFGLLLPILQSQLEKDRSMQLQVVYLKLKKNEISKDAFVRHMKSIVGDQMLIIAAHKLQAQLSGRKMQVPSASDFSNSSNNNAAKPPELESQTDAHGSQVGQMSTSSLGALSSERKHPAFPAQGLNKMHHMQLSQTAIKPQALYIQTRHAPPPNLAVNHLRSISRPMNETNMSTFDGPHSLSDLKCVPAGVRQQIQAQWPSSTRKVHKIYFSPPMAHVKQEPSDQSNEQQKAQLSASHVLSSLPPEPNKLRPAASWNLKNEPIEIQSSRTGITLPTALVPPSSVSTPSPIMMETNTLTSSRIPSLTAPVGPGNSSKALPEKPLIGQKKPMEVPGSSPPSSKKRKVSGSFVDQSIEHLNDVTAVSGVNLREEEEQLLSVSQEHSRVSEAYRRVVQEEEERLILQKIPLRRKMVDMMAKCGLKNMSKDVERCLSLCVEERMRGLISNVIRHSKQRADTEKTRHKMIITSDVGKEIMAINRKAREEWEKKQGETNNEPESSMEVDADKETDNVCGKSTKANKDKDDKMRATAANVAVRAATGVGDFTSRWKLMIEAKQKQGGPEISSGPQTNKVAGRKLLAARNTRGNQESKKSGCLAALTTPSTARKVGQRQVFVPRVARRVSVKDVIAVLEREPQMSKSTLLYRLYHKVSDDSKGQ